MHEEFLQGWKLQREGKVAEALVCYERGKQEGDKCALFHWNCMDRYGQDIPSNINNFIKWDTFTLLDDEFECLYECYRDIDEAEIHFNLGIAYNIRKRPDDALDSYLKARARDYLPTFGGLGLHYNSLRNYDEAFKWFTLGAERGCSRSQCALGYYYSQGFGCNEDYDDAIKWWKLSVIQNYHVAYYNLGFIYEHGSGVPKDIDEAIRYYRLAAEIGYDGARVSLGDMYKLDNGKNYKEMIKWYRLAADNGDATGQGRLGNLYEKGIGVPQNYLEAMRWYQLAANQGCSFSQAKLGLFYKNGYGTDRDYLEASKWFRLSADQGTKWSQYKLAELYENGKGLEQSYFEAVKYYQMAMTNGFNSAKKKLNNILSFETKINTSLQEFIPIGSMYGISYLFFGNFLSFLTKKYTITNWNDPLLKPWIIKALVTYFQTKNPDFPTNQVTEWYRDLYADD